MIKAEKSSDFNAYLVEGKFSAERNEELRNKFLEIFESDAEANVIVDMSSVSLLPTCCIGVFISAYKKFNETGGRIILCNMQPGVQTVFECTGLTEIFEIHPDLDAAKNMLA